MRSLTVLVVGVAATLVSGPVNADVLIGAAGPTTGKFAWVGEQVFRGAEMAVADINAAGGVLGQQLRLATADDFCDPKQAVAAAQKLVSDGAIFVAGHSCSGAAIPASKIYEAADVVLISSGSTNPKLTDQGLANVFRTIGRDDAQGAAAGNYLADNWADKKIAILHDDTTYGAGLGEETKKQLNKRGIAEAIYAEYVPGKSDYSAEIAKLQDGGIAVLYVGGYHTEAALMARAAYEKHYALQVVSGDTLSTEEFGLIAGAAADGTLFTFGADPREDAEAAPVVARFRADNFEPEGYTLNTYAAVQAWVQAVEDAGSLDPQAVKASLHSGHFDTVLGQIAFDAKGDLTTANWIWYVWRDGKYVPLQ